MKTRANFYVDSDRMEALKQLAASEENSISELVREGIDRVILDRMNKPKSERNQLRANLADFLARHVGSGPDRTLQEIEDLVSDPEPV